MMKVVASILVMLLVISCGQKADEKADAGVADTTVEASVFEGETHIQNIRQLTFGGQNAEAYWNGDGTMLSYQAMVGDMQCDQIFTMNADGSNKQMVSTGQGVTTCAFIDPNDPKIIYASTHLVHDSCPPKPDMTQGYVWALYEAYDIFQADLDGSNLVQLTNTPGYDAEAVYSPQGDKIIFTSVRTGDLELFIMDESGENVEQITDMPGYDGGAFFSNDGEWIVWRASRPEGPALEEYRDLLAQGLIRPNQLDIYIMNLNDREPIRLTDNEAANFAPYFHPDGKHVIFCSNMLSAGGRDFDLFLINIETKETEQVTYNTTFDGFPMFSYDGSKLVFASNRDNAEQFETNIFVADWVW